MVCVRYGHPFEPPTRLFRALLPYLFEQRLGSRTTALQRAGTFYCDFESEYVDWIVYEEVVLRLVGSRGRSRALSGQSLPIAIGTVRFAVADRLQKAGGRKQNVAIQQSRNLEMKFVG